MTDMLAKKNGWAECRGAGDEKESFTYAKETMYIITSRRGCACLV